MRERILPTVASSIMLPPSPLLNHVITISNVSRNETIGYHTVIVFVLLCNVSFFVLDDFNTDMH